MQPSVGDAAAVLSALGAGERFWFWFSPDLPEEQARLVVSSLRTDPGMEGLQTAASAQAVPAGGRLSMGMGSVSADGRVQLGAPGLGGDELAALAGWAQRHADEHPALSRLKDARLLSTRPDGVVSASFEDAALWEGMLAPPAPGTLAFEAEALASLPAGQSSRYWMCADGPRLVVVPLAVDPDGAVFQARVRAHQRAVGAAPVAGGVVRALSGALALTTTGELETLAAIAAALVQTGQLGRLSGARLVQMAGGKFVRAQTLAGAGPDLSVEARLLEGLDASSRLVFWLTRDGDGGQPRLMLDVDMDALKPRVRASGLRGASTRGLARLSSKGWLEFRTQKDLEGFLPALAAFATAHQGGCPALQRLAGARLTVRDDDGEITARYRDDALWASLR